MRKTQFFFSVQKGHTLKYGGKSPVSVMNLTTSGQISFLTAKFGKKLVFMVKNQKMFEKNKISVSVSQNFLVGKGCPKRVS